MRDGVMIGNLALLRNFVQPFTDKQIELVATFADQAVIAIHNANLFAELQASTRDLTEALERQTATSEVLNVISRSPSDLQPVLDTIVETAARLCRAEKAQIFLRRDGAYRWASGYGDMGPEYLAIERPEQEGVLLHGVYHLHKNLGVDESVIWGDHFFVEALVKILTDARTLDI